MSAAPDEALSNAAEWIKDEATTATRPGQMASLDRLADVVKEGAHRLAAVTARAEAAEAKVARIETLAGEWEDDYPTAAAACNRDADEWWTDLRAALADEGDTDE